MVNVAARADPAIPRRDAGVPLRDMAGSGMDSPPRKSPPGSTRNSMAGGFLIAAGAMLGACLGFLIEEATRGFLVGSAAGAGMAIAIWLIDRRR